MTTSVVWNCDSKQDQISIENMEDIRRDRQSEALTGQQMRSKGEDGYSTESVELKDDSTSDGGEKVTPFETQPRKEPGLV